LGGEGCGLWFGIGVGGWGFGVWGLRFRVYVLKEPAAPCSQRQLQQPDSPSREAAVRWFGVWGLGFGVWGLGFGVWGLGFDVWGLMTLDITCCARLCISACDHNQFQTEGAKHNPKP
jgi:hypothetical protein